MEYISAEEFLKQDKEVQKVFLDWWQPQECDLFQCSKFGRDIVLNYDEDRENNEILGNCGGCCYGKDDITPLLTEGQLRKFIEDKTGGKIIIIELDGTSYNIISNFKNFINTDSDLLKAYWKAALEAARCNL